jgi:hypothetical protein
LAKQFWLALPDMLTNIPPESGDHKHHGQSFFEWASAFFLIASPKDRRPSPSLGPRSVRVLQIKR